MKVHQIPGPCAVFYFKGNVRDRCAADKHVGAAMFENDETIVVIKLDSIPDGADLIGLILYVVNMAEAPPRFCEILEGDVTVGLLPHGQN